MSTNVDPVSRAIVTYYSAFGPIENMSPRALYLANIVNWAVLYSSFILATLLWCTIFIVYRILRVTGIAGMRVYHRVVEMLVESASLYSTVLIVLLVFEVHNEGVAGSYVEELAIAARGIIPTILVGRIAAGHARPDDSWSENTTASSLQFKSHSDLQSDSSETSAGSLFDTSPHIIPDIENGLEDRTQI
ncbi:uncharacterized protein EV420DRAFT_1569083 [Desarmillaria tabescens]|uniref:Uncharacterized protein n=1 Tax=Armillaria tabescens TaxID=1929756 RepID=A0AA39JQ94_ARMTA|nr:uncharacterized protein EV420DRAFT_1569083 [Desarmillaria tabescens]KAK0446946.1 hypothetical protein EV420DRAFT_1569083 [Desarmillaria tabescens]